MYPFLDLLKVLPVDLRFFESAGVPSNPWEEDVRIDHPLLSLSFNFCFVQGLQVNPERGVLRTSFLIKGTKFPLKYAKLDICR